MMMLLMRFSLFPCLLVFVFFWKGITDRRFLFGGGASFRKDGGEKETEGMKRREESKKGDGKKKR